MYDADNHDNVVEIPGFPQSSIGAPNPVVVSDEHTLVVAFYLQDTPEGWDGRDVRIVGSQTNGEPLALVRFNRCYAYMFGPPNDEAISGHPLASRGLSPYGAYSIEESSWIKNLEQMNSVHPHHVSRFLKEFNHYILTFHDSTLECVAKSYDMIGSTCSIEQAIPQMKEMLGWDETV